MHLSIFIIYYSQPQPEEKRVRSRSRSVAIIARFSVPCPSMLRGKVGAMRSSSPSQLIPLISGVRVLQWAYIQKNF